MTLDLDLPAFRVGEGTLWAGRRLADLYAEAMTPWEWYPDLAQAAAERGLVLFSTPFDATAVDFLAGQDAPAYKIASFELVDLPLIRRARGPGPPADHVHGHGQRRRGRRRRRGGHRRRCRRRGPAAVQQLLPGTQRRDGPAHHHRHDRPLVAAGGPVRPHPGPDRGDRGHRAGRLPGGEAPDARPVRTRARLGLLVAARRVGGHRGRRPGGRGRPGHRALRPVAQRAGQPRLPAVSVGDPGGGGGEAFSAQTWPPCARPAGWLPTSSTR